MDITGIGDKIEKGIKEYKEDVHWVLAHSYSFYFLMFLIGVLFDIVLPIKILEESITLPLGILLIFLATALICWAQKTSRNLKKEEVTKSTFSRGPYSFTRSPTHWGLFLLMLGFGLTINALFIIASSLVSFVVTKIVFLRKEENILKEKYGEPYTEYKKSVKL